MYGMPSTGLLVTPKAITLEYLQENNGGIYENNKTRYIKQSITEHHG